MKKTIRVFAGFAAISALATAPLSCSSKHRSVNSDNEQNSSQVQTDIPATSEAAVKDMNITWLADYALAPADNGSIPPALALFQDSFGGSVSYVLAEPGKKLDKLTNMINAGETVDMLPYDTGDLPEGVLKGLYAPLDPYYNYLEMNKSGLWDGMKPTIDRLAYNGQHYVIPYSVSDPQILTYSRKLIKDNELDDPYKLYTEGKWTWDTFMDIMEKFVEKAPAGTKRYGINGWFGQSALLSTGHTVVKSEGGRLVNNISDPSLEKAEKLMQDIVQKGLYRTGWRDYYPTDLSTLFFASADYTLGASNAKNGDADLMAVPFPKSPDADGYYGVSAFNAKMLAANSSHGEAVATYIMCERYAATDKKLAEAAKKSATAVKKTGNSIDKSYVTEEQYDALMSYTDPSKVVPAFDFGCGMGGKMYSPGDYNYDSMGVIDKLERTFLDYPDRAESWEALRDGLSAIIDAEAGRFNK